MYGYIYKTTNLVNGKIYIGQHKADKFTPSYRGSGSELKKAFSEFGYKNFKVELLATAESFEELDNLEKIWIEKLSARNNNIGYNRSKGGRSNSYFIQCKHTEEEKRKISESSKNRIWISKEGFNKFIKKDLLNDYLNLAWKTGRCVYNQDFVKTPEYRMKLSALNKGKKRYTDGKVVLSLSESDFKGTYEKLGFKPGIRSKKGEIIYTNIVIWNGTTYKKTNSIKLNYYLDRGWSLMETPKEEALLKYSIYKKNLKEMRARITREIIINYHKTVSEEANKTRIEKIKQKRWQQTNLNLYSNKGKHWVTNGLENLLVFEVNPYLEKGYRLGQTLFKEGYVSHNKGKKASKELRRKLSESHKGLQKNNKWINNGFISKRIDKTLLEKYLAEGWKLGRLRNESR